MIPIPTAAVLHQQFPAARIHVRDGQLVAFDTWVPGDDERALPFSHADLAAWSAAWSAAYSPPSAIPVPVQLIADKILSLWATTRLPPPADWDTAIELLEASAEPDILRLALKLLALRVALSEAGGTWPQVLALAIKD